jgi:hypothetical protein
MATVITSDLIESISGRMGDLIFRTYNGRTVVSSRPVIPASRRKKQSELQAYRRSRFREASIFSKKMMLDPIKKEYYRRKAKEMRLTNAYTAALTHYLRTAKITEVECKATSEGDVIKFHACRKDFRITSIDVLVVNADHSVAGEYKAVNYNGNYWKLKVPDGVAGVQTLWLDIAHDTGEVWREHVVVYK